MGAGWASLVTLLRPRAGQPIIADFVREGGKGGYGKCGGLDPQTLGRLSPKGTPLFADGESERRSGTLSVQGLCFYSHETW